MTLKQQLIVKGNRLQNFVLPQTDTDILLCKDNRIHSRGILSGVPKMGYQSGICRVILSSYSMAFMPPKRALEGALCVSCLDAKLE